MDIDSLFAQGKVMMLDKEIKAKSYFRAVSRQREMLGGFHHALAGRNQLETGRAGTLERKDIAVTSLWAALKPRLPTGFGHRISLIPKSSPNGWAGIGCPTILPGVPTAWPTTTRVSPAPSAWGGRALPGDEQNVWALYEYGIRKFVF